MEIGLSHLVPNKAIKDGFGAFGIEGDEYKQSHLWLLSFNYDSIVLAGQVHCYGIRKDSTMKDSTIKIKGQGCVFLPVAKQLTEGNFTVSRSPGTYTVNPLINSSITSDIMIIDIGTKYINTRARVSCSNTLINRLLPIIPIN